MCQMEYFSNLLELFFTTFENIGDGTITFEAEQFDFSTAVWPVANSLGLPSSEGRHLTYVSTLRCGMWQVDMFNFCQKPVESKAKTSFPT